MAAKKPKSFWISSTEETDFPPLPKKLEVDAIIIGGGIVGITTAALLLENGIRAAILDSGKIITGEKGHTSAKITSLHGLKYRQLIERFGEKSAGIYAAANQAAIEKIAHFTDKRFRGHFKARKSGSA